MSTGTKPLQDVSQQAVYMVNILPCGPKTTRDTSWHKKPQFGKIKAAQKR